MSYPKIVINRLTLEQGTVGTYLGGQRVPSEPEISLSVDAHSAYEAYEEFLGKSCFLLRPEDANSLLALVINSIGPDISESQVVGLVERISSAFYTMFGVQR